MEHMDTMTQVLEELRKKGYEKEFVIKEDRIEDEKVGLALNHDQFDIDEVHRFEGFSDPGDNAVVYAVTAENGEKGVIIDGYGTYSEQISPELAKKLSRATGEGSS